MMVAQKWRKGVIGLFEGLQTTFTLLNLLYIMDCMCALGAMGTASYDRSKAMLLSFLFWQSLYRSCGYIASLCPVLSSAFFNAPELSRILWAVLDMPSTLSLLSICRSFVSV